MIAVCAVSHVLFSLTIPVLTCVVCTDVWSTQVDEDTPLAELRSLAARKIQWMRSVGEEKAKAPLAPKQKKRSVAKQELVTMLTALGVRPRTPSLTREPDPQEPARLTPDPD
jgi:hypothetical protein